jgi:hypothetical protein
MEAQTTAGTESVARPSAFGSVSATSTTGFKLPQLPVRDFGLRSVPALPVDVVGMLDTLRRLSVKLEQRKQALEGLARTFTIGGSTARAYTFLYGDAGPDAQGAAANKTLRGVLHEFLSHNPLEVLPKLIGKLRGQDNELANDTAGSRDDITARSLEDPKQWSIGWTTFPDVYTLGLPYLDEWAATVDVTQPDKATEAFFPTIARYGLGYNLILPKKVQGRDVGMWQDLFGTEWTTALDAAAKAGLLYVIDLRIYETLQPQKVAGIPRFTPSTVTVLVQNAATKAMTPELIRVAGGGNAPKIFNRQSSTTPSAWVYALQAAKVSVTVYGIWLAHVYEWHIVTAAMQMTMFEHLSANHPVHKLLAPQSNYLIPFDDVLLLGFNTLAEVPPTSIVTTRQFLELLELYARSRRFLDDDPTTKLEQLGLTQSDFTVDEPWDQYPIVGHYLAIWDATGRYVNACVDRAYPTDRDVQRDQEVQAWIAQSGKEDDGNVRGLPAMDSKDALKRVLQSVIYRITAHGTSRLYGAGSGNPAFAFVANFPPTLQDATIPDPTASFDTATLHRFLPTTGTIGSMLHFYATFWASPPYVPLVPIEGIDTDLFFDDPVSNEALIEFRRFIVGFTERLQPDTPQIWQWERNIEL